MDIVPGNAGLYTLHQYSIVMEAQQGYTCAVDIVTFLTDTHQDLGLQMTVREYTAAIKGWDAPNIDQKIIDQSVC